MANNIFSKLSKVVIKSFGGFTETEVKKAVKLNITDKHTYEPKGVLDSVDAQTAKTQGASTEADFTTLYRIYKQESWVRACVDIIKRASLANSWKIVANPRVENANETVKEQLETFFEYPNTEDSFDDILTDVIGDLETYGNAYIELVRNGKGEVQEIYNLDATTLKVKHDEHGVILGYIQQGDSGDKVKFEPDEVIHFKLAAKGSSIYGLSPLESLIRPVDTDLKAQIYIAKYYENFGAPKALFKFKNATPEQVRRNRLYLATQVAGVENAHKNLVLEGDVEYTPLGTAMKDTETLKIREYLRDEILAVYGVPPSKISIIKTGQLGGNVDQGQDRTFKLETIIPLQRNVATKLTHKLIRGIFEIQDWSLSFGDVLEQDRKIEADIHGIYLTNKVLTIDEVREDLGREPLERETEGDETGNTTADNKEDADDGMDGEKPDTENESENELSEEEVMIVGKQFQENFKPTHTVNSRLNNNELLVKSKKLTVNFDKFAGNEKAFEKAITRYVNKKVQEISEKI